MWFSRGRLAGLILLLTAGWWWFLGIVFWWGDSMRGVAGAVVLLTGGSLLALGWRGGLVMALACLLALAQGLAFDDSWARQQWLFHSKLGQIRQARLAYVPEWGWVDRRHSLSELCGRSEGEHLFFGSWGRVYLLRFSCFPKNLSDCCSALLQLGERCEAEEQKLPWYSAAPLSAYNADDLPSVYWTLFRRVYPETRYSECSAVESERRWWLEGRQLVRRRVRGWRDFEPAQVELRAPYRKLFEELERAPLPVSIEVKEERL